MRLIRPSLASALVAAAIVCGWSTAAPAATFEYDALSRLIRYIGDNGVTIRYCYDAAGNRRQVTVNAACPASIMGAGASQSAQSPALQVNKITPPPRPEFPLPEGTLRDRKS